MNSTTNIDMLNTLPPHLQEKYILAWVAQGTARAEWYRGQGNAHDLNRAQVRLMSVTMEIALNCADTDHYIACKNTLDRQAYGLLRVEESYSFGSWISAPFDAGPQWTHQVA